VADDAPWIELRVTVPVARVPELSDVLLELGAVGLQEEHAGLDFGDDGPVVPEHWVLPEPVSPTGAVDLIGWFAPGPDPASLLATLHDRSGLPGALRDVADEDWNENWKRSWKPGRLCDRIIVVPSWERQPELASGELPLVMDPGQAFGTGTHPTTRLCATFLDRLLAERTERSILDVGTGTGVLAIAALLLGAPRAVGVDTDRLSVEAALENGQVNGVADRFEVLAGGVEVAGDRRFDVVVANLLAPLLIEIAAPLVARTTPGGVLLASGILCDQADAVTSALTAAGAVLAERADHGEWVSLRLERP
jgi:ribosomal protein L11 methyltransferase